MLVEPSGIILTINLRRSHENTTRRAMEFMGFRTINSNIALVDVRVSANANQPMGR